MQGEVILAFGTLVAIVNPISTSFVFNHLCHDDDMYRRRQIAKTAAMAAALVMLSFMIVGDHLMHFFNITVYAFRIAGGLFMGKIAFDMLDRHLRHSPEQYSDVGPEKAIIPLAIPLLSGPGSLTTVLVLSQTYSIVAVTIAILAVCALAWFTLRNAHQIDHALGRVGVSVVERLLGLLVLVIAVQFVFNGVTGYLTVLGVIQ